MSAIFIDETAGSDETGQGTETAPYKSLAHALYAGGAESKLLMRKDDGWDEPTQSALKKAKKGADGLEKKRKKAEELKEREAAAGKEERERREKLIEESKKIVLKEDEALPKAKKVCTGRLHAVDQVLMGVNDAQAKLVELGNLRGQRIRVSGWVHRLRQQKDIIFVVLRDGTAYLQAVLSGQVVSPTTC
jgi:asparaginyl-tRNA synthetase